MRNADLFRWSLFKQNITAGLALVLLISFVVPALSQTGSRKAPIAVKTNAIKGDGKIGASTDDQIPGVSFVGEMGCPKGNRRDHGRPNLFQAFDQAEFLPRRLVKGIEDKAQNPSLWFRMSHSGKQNLHSHKYSLPPLRR
jgi:hypothetical protein